MGERGAARPLERIGKWGTRGQGPGLGPETARHRGPAGQGAPQTGRARTLRGPQRNCDTQPAAFGDLGAGMAGMAGVVASFAGKGYESGHVASPIYGIDAPPSIQVDTGPRGNA